MIGAMNRRAAIALLIGWLLGLGTAAAAPDLVTQRKTIAGGQLAAHLRDGWYVLRFDDSSAWTVERRRIRLP